MAQGSAGSTAAAASAALAAAAFLSAVLRLLDRSATVYTDSPASSSKVCQQPQSDLNTVDCKGCGVIRLYMLAANVE